MEVSDGDRGSMHMSGIGFDFDPKSVRQSNEDQKEWRSVITDLGSFSKFWNGNRFSLLNLERKVMTDGKTVQWAMGGNILKVRNDIC
jgi:hypothetical protein